MNRMKSLIISLCMLVTLCSGCVVNKPIESEGKPPATELVLISQRDTFEIDETYNLLWSFMPEGSEHELIKFESSDPIIVSVDENGKMTMLEEGTTTITGVTSSGLTDSVEIQVNRPKVKEMVMIEPRSSSIELRIGATFQLEWSFEPAKSLWPEIEWQSQDEAIATINETGLVTALKEGNVNIIGRYDINDIATSFMINVNVLPKQEFGEYVNFIDRIIKTNTTLQFKNPYYFETSDGKYGGVGFKCLPFLEPILETDISSYELINVIKNVEGDKVTSSITFTSPDLYRIEVYTNGGNQIVCYVLATDAELPETLTLEVGDTYALLPPESLNTAGQRYSLSLDSSDQSIAYVNDKSFYFGGDGNITALKPGVVTVTLYGDIMSSKEPIDTCVVTIKEKSVETEIIPEEEKKEDATKSEIKPDAKPDTKPKPTPRPDPDDDYDPTPTPKPEVKVVEIQGVPEYVISGKEIVLDDIVKVSPNNATYKKIEWSLVDVNQTYLKLSVDEDGKTIIKGISDSSSGVKLQAKITNGLLSEDFVQEFYIKVLYDIDIEGYYDTVNTIKIKLNEGLDIDLKASNGAGGPYTFELKEGDKLPDGIELVIDEDDENKLSAQLKGSTSQVGEPSFTITVTDKDGNTRDFNFKLIVEAEENTELEVELTHTDLKVAKVNEVYSVTFSALEYEGELTFELLNSDLPGEFTVDKIKTETGNTATLTGTPTTAGTYTFTIRVSDESGKSKDFEYTLVVKEEATVSPENEIPTS